MDSTMKSMAELAPKRRIMESQVGGAEVRRIHVIYFLSRKGHIEHPHLIRVHHLSRNGVHLRDVKRWLSELRGKEMPDAFVWSYKRRYKNGYVWQDLLDEDLITPISDNEFVLKGSEISFTRNNSTNSRDDDNSLSQKQSPTTTKEEVEGPQETKMEEPRKSAVAAAAFPEMDRESSSFGSEKSTLTDDLSSSSLSSSSTKIGEDNHNSHDQFKVEILIHKEREEEEEEDKTEDHSFLCTSSKGNTEEKVLSSTTSDSVSAGNTFKRSKSYSNGLFRNLISCGSSDTNDSALVAINKRNNKNNHHAGAGAGAKLILTKGDKFGGSQSQREFGTTLNRQSPYASRRSFDGVSNPSKNKTEFSNQKEIPPYKPINGPQCSQCGKPFKPEKMHAHMKSCKGMKAMIAKGTRPEISAKGSQRRSSEFAFDNDSPSVYYLMHQQ